MLVAFTVTVCELVIETGAVYRPADGDAADQRAERPGDGAIGGVRPRWRKTAGSETGSNSRWPDSPSHSQTDSM